MEWLTTALIITGVWAWIIPIIFFFIILAFSENEQNVWAFIFLTTLLIILQVSGIISIFTNPFMVLAYLAGYFIVGGVWSVVKWWLFINKMAIKYVITKANFIKSINEKNLDIKLNSNSKIPKTLIKDFKEYLVGNYFHYQPYGLYLHDDLRLIVPSAHDHKKKIVTWIIWWPTSMFWTLLNEPLVKFANWIYNKFQGVYGLISQRAFKKFDL